MAKASVMFDPHKCRFKSRWNSYLSLISCCFTSTNFGLKVIIFLIIKQLKVLFPVDISKILVHAVITHDSVLFYDIALPLSLYTNSYWFIVQICGFHSSSVPHLIFRPSTIFDFDLCRMLYL